MPKINRKAFPLPRRPRFHCPSCQTFCKHCHTWRRGPPRAKTAASKHRSSHEHISIVPLRDSALRLGAVLCTRVQITHTHSVTENRPDIWKKAGKNGDKESVSEQAEQTTPARVTPIFSYTKRHKKETTGYLHNTIARDYYRSAFHDAEEMERKRKR